MNDPNIKKSLLDGRNHSPLSEQEIRRATNIFVGMDNTVNVRYEENTITRFAINKDENGHEFGEVIFSNDIYPGQNIVNPNAALSLSGAAAHELTHFYRWSDKTELPHKHMTHIDEAMTSLEAALRFSGVLNATDMQGLISDSLHRLKLFVAEQTNNDEPNK